MPRRQQLRRIHAGTSGWVYKGWRAHLYADAPMRRWLEIASRVFSSLEINGSFYGQIAPNDGRDVFVYFDNDAEGHAVRNALAFAQLVGDRSHAEMHAVRP